ncbi:TetR/AcrR family transcriptional regulator [Flagellimonas sp. GZD32]|uniref:TetR/AcrR family transcriptional regulator n=1 Tax=Flagellimonas cixiensis TaxID=3228750 RepID=UPI0035C9010A
MKDEHIQTGRKKQKQNTRDNILSSTKTLLEKNEVLTMEKIAQHAGISRATIYRYYSNTDSISTDLALQLNVPDTEAIIEQHKTGSPSGGLLQIQKAFLEFSIENEQASRKFLAAVLSTTHAKMSRGQNRINALKAYFKSQNIPLTSAEQEKLIHIAVLLMGIESIITAKDVCGLENESTIDTMTWGLQMILKGCNMQ